MKVNLISNGHPINGYLNIDPFVQEGNEEKIQGDFSNLDLHVEDSEANEIIAMHVMKHVPFKNIYTLFQHWAKKLRIGGKIVVCDTDASEVCKKYANNDINILQFNELIYGQQTDPSKVINCMITMVDIIGVLENLGLKVTKKRLDGFQMCVEATREK